jgi:hypothetical protein
MIQNKFKLDKDQEIKILKRYTLQDMSYSRTLRNICKLADLTCQRLETRTRSLHYSSPTMVSMHPISQFDMFHGIFIFNATDLALLMVV